MDTLGTRLAALLAEKGMTQTRLADKAGCTRIAVSYYVNCPGPKGIGAC